MWRIRARQHVRVVDGGESVPYSTCSCCRPGCSQVRGCFGRQRKREGNRCAYLRGIYDTLSFSDISQQHKLEGSRTAQLEAACMRVQHSATCRLCYKLQCSSRRSWCIAMTVGGTLGKTEDMWCTPTDLCAVLVAASAGSCVRMNQE